MNAIENQPNETQDWSRTQSQMTNRFGAHQLGQAPSANIGKTLSIGYNPLRLTQSRPLVDSSSMGQQNTALCTAAIIDAKHVNFNDEKQRPSMATVPSFNARVSAIPTELEHLPVCMNQDLSSFSQMNHVFMIESNVWM